jgi:hypothetical protein
MVSYGTGTQQKTVFGPLIIHPAWCTGCCWFTVAGFCAQKTLSDFPKVVIWGSFPSAIAPSRDKGGCGYSVVSNSRGSLVIFERENWWAKIKESTLNCQFWWKPPNSLKILKIWFFTPEVLYLILNFFPEKPKTAVLWFYQKTSSISKF